MAELLKQLDFDAGQGATTSHSRNDDEELQPAGRQRMSFCVSLLAVQTTRMISILIPPLVPRFHSITRRIGLGVPELREANYWSRMCGIGSHLGVERNPSLPRAESVAYCHPVIKVHYRVGLPHLRTIRL